MKHLPSIRGQLVLCTHFLAEPFFTESLSSCSSIYTVFQYLSKKLSKFYIQKFFRNIVSVSHAVIGIINWKFSENCTFVNIVLINCPTINIACSSSKYNIVAKYISC